MTPVVHTPRLRLEPYTPADEEEFVALFQDPQVAQWMGDGLSPEAEDRALFGRVFSKVYANDLFDVWAVRLAETGRFVGHAEIKPSPNPRVDGHELVYALAHDSWGTGLGTELANAIVAYGFERLDLPAVYATVAPANEASLALLRKIGFTHLEDLQNDDGTTTRVLGVRREQSR